MLAEAAAIDWFAGRYGWTPDQIDNLPAWLHRRLPTVAAVRAEVEAEHRRRG